MTNDYEKGYQDAINRINSGDIGGGFFGRDRSEEYKRGFLEAWDSTIDRKDELVYDRSNFIEINPHEPMKD